MVSSRNIFLTSNVSEPIIFLCITIIIMDILNFVPDEGALTMLMGGEMGSILTEMDMMLTPDQYLTLYEPPSHNRYISMLDSRLFYLTHFLV